MTDPNSRKVQLKAKPTAFQYGPSNPSRTSNHCNSDNINTNFKDFFLFLGIWLMRDSDLNDVVFEADTFFFLSASKLDV